MARKKRYTRYQLWAQRHVGSRSYSAAKVPVRVTYGGCLKLRYVPDFRALYWTRGLAEYDLMRVLRTGLKAEVRVVRRAA
jgi:hypothetical protein